MPSPYRVIVLPEAFGDLDRILDYIRIEENSPQNAALTLDRLWEACQSLAMLPRRFEIHQNRKDATKTVHAMPMRPYIIYYRIDENASTVRTLTIRHGARKQPRRFK